MVKFIKMFKLKTNIEMKETKNGYYLMNVILIIDQYQSIQSWKYQESGWYQLRR